jgi:hypothetical protein
MSHPVVGETVCRCRGKLCEQNVPEQVRVLMERQSGDSSNKMTVGADGRATQ